jgi:CHAD domain-containing protein/CYTH domain-containing protein
MASFESSILEDTAPRAARLVALGLLDDVVRERERLKAERGSETLHDFRVALRRLRSWLRGQRPLLEDSIPRPVSRRLRRMARESNVGRDAEVFRSWLTEAEAQLAPRERSAARWLLARFDRQQQEADAGLEQRLARDFDRVRDRLQSRLSTYRVVAHVHAGLREPVFAASMAVLLRDHADDLRRRLRRVQSADDIRQAHQARIAGKRLRYLLEPIAPHIEGGDALVEQLKNLQDALGDLHDSHIWLLVLRDVVAELAIEEGYRMARAFSPAAVAPSAGRRRGPPRAGFVALARMAQERSTGAFDRFVNQWNDRTAKRFFRDANRLAKTLKARSSQVLEIERKYLLTALPARLPESTALDIQQGYLPGDRVVERLRSVETDGQRSYFRTIKVGTGVVRTELEEATSREVFDTMWPLTFGKRLTKRRHLVPTGELTWEIDEFTDRPLVLAEIELPDPDASVEFPDWLAPYVDREVTGEQEYLNWTLAR